MIGDDVVDGEFDFPAGLGEEAFGEIDLVALDEAFADFLALGEEEGVGHGAADEEGVALAEELLDDVDFVGDFCAAEDGDEGVGGFG